MADTATGTTGTATRAEVCAAACADLFRGDGEMVAAAVSGMVPALGARLARTTFEPGLLTTDGNAYLTAEPIPLGAEAGAVEGWLPFRDHLWLVLNGRRHVVLGASQLDRHGNSNISCVGEWSRPKAQLIASRGAPGNTICNITSYWIPRHTSRVFVPKVDFVSGIGNDRTPRPFQLRRVVSDLAVLDFGGPDGTLRLVSVHPGVTVDDVVAATGFELDIPASVPQTRSPSAEELRIMREVLDPRGLREREVPA